MKLPAATILEKEWDAQLFGSEKGLAPMLGWTSYHTLRSKGSQPGYPDRTLVRERIIFAELKTDSGRPTAEQRDWLDRLARAGGEVYLWRPRDLPDIGRLLSGAYAFLPASDDLLEPRPHSTLVTPIGATWTPLSMWLPGRGRFDGG